MVDDGLCWNLACRRRAPDPMAFIFRLDRDLMRLCPSCAGILCSMLVRYFQGRKRDGLTRKTPPKNRMLPRRDGWGEPRCRECEKQLPDWKAGEPPFCEPCGQANSAGSPKSVGSSPGRC